MAVPAGLKKPAKETFRLWLNSHENWYTYRDRYGEKAANARFLGIGKHIEATEILEYVLIDHTVLDVWAIVEDKDGNAIFVERPTLTLAIDLHARMILGAVLSFEPPSIYNVMAVLKEVTRFKEFLAEHGHAQGATDGWGKPHCVIVDNGWEFAGSSFQTTLEGTGINVIWAPVKTPQFKAVVERIFGRLNDLVWHRIEGGIPLTPQMRSKLELEPQGNAIFNIDDLRRKMWHAIVHVIHLEPHSALEKAPALAWAQSKARDGRRVVDDIAVFDSMLGQAERAWISRSGIELDNQIFHDQRITTELLERLKQHAEKSGGFEKGLFKRRKIGVLVTTDRVDASYIMVWDPSSKRGVRLPNVRAEFTKGTSWRLIKRLRAFAAAENLAFRSEDDMIYARAELSRRLKEVGFFPTFREARPWAPDIDQSPALNPGDTVKIIEVGQEEDIPSSSAAAFREDSRRSAIQADRGKNKGSARSRKKSKKPASGRTKPLDRQASKPLDSPTPNPLVSRDPPGRWDADPGMSNKDAAETMRRLKSERNQ